jgi:hypothetical protein
MMDSRIMYRLQDGTDGRSVAKKSKQAVLAPRTLLKHLTECEKKTVLSCPVGIFHAVGKVLSP